MHSFTRIVCGLLLGVLAMTPSSFAENLPDNITIDSLQNLYAPVVFGHAQHIMRERDCAVCHHHTNGAPAAEDRCIRCHKGGHEITSMGCKSCHEKEPFSAEVVNSKFKNNLIFHQDKPGLKASYHLGCIGCHQKKGGPVTCTDCHALTSNGEAFYRSGKFAPDPRKANSTGHH